MDLEGDFLFLVASGGQKRKQFLLEISSGDLLCWYGLTFQQRLVLFGLLDFLDLGLQFQQSGNKGPILNLGFINGRI